MCKNTSSVFLSDVTTVVLAEQPRQRPSRPPRVRCCSFGHSKTFESDQLTPPPLLFQVAGLSRAPSSLFLSSKTPRPTLPPTSSTLRTFTSASSTSTRPLRPTAEHTEHTAESSQLFLRQSLQEAHANKFTLSALTRVTPYVLAASLAQHQTAPLTKFSSLQCHIEIVVAAAGVEVPKSKDLAAEDASEPPALQEIEA